MRGGRCHPLELGSSVVWVCASKIACRCCLSPLLRSFYLSLNIQLPVSASLSAHSFESFEFPIFAFYTPPPLVRFYPRMPTLLSQL